ncbi:MAG: hypothetical protein AAGG51_01705 [Cyanobacteria bacterium P01_G01_bin.54]
MYYLYFFANASLTLRLTEYLLQMPHLDVTFVSVIHQIDGWIVRIKLNNTITPEQHGDLVAYLSELGVAYTPDIHVQMALWSLETGQSPVGVMRRYQVAVVSHGIPDKADIEAFRHQFMRGLGYCPETLA